MEVTSTRLKNTGKLDQNAYNKFVAKEAKKLQKMWSVFNPGESLTDEEALIKADDICSMYKHQFMIFEKVV